MLTPPAPAQNTSSLLLAFDFDGTIAPIVDRPDDARLDRTWSATIQEMSLRSGVAVAIISGRDLEDLHQRTSSLHVYRAGSHGAECSDPAGRMLWGAESSPLVLNHEIAELLARADFRIERKKFGLAVHFRHLPASAVRSSVLDHFVAWARTHDLDILVGRSVIEARVRSRNKVSALRLLARHTGAQRVLFAGDDVTDFEALSWAAQHGQGVFVESCEREPPSDPDVVRVAGINSLLQIVSGVVQQQLPLAVPGSANVGDEAPLQREER
jgi:trehalose-phosphatase